MKILQKPRPPQLQTLLNLRPTHEKEIDGIGMGVLSDGTAYLTGTGLAKMCGIAESTIREIATNWPSEQTKKRGGRILEILHKHNYTNLTLFIPITVLGAIHHAYPDSVCMAFLEYYAFEAESNKKEQAEKNYRLLAWSSLRAFVYTQVGYDSRNQIPDPWKKFHDRVSSAYNKIPVGYFGIFKEVADMVVAMIQAGVPVDEKTVPDISVGMAWAEHWRKSAGDVIFGVRQRYQHSYPDYFPQAASNPQECWAYPEAALAEFRKWMRQVYLPQKFPNYLANQTKMRALPPSVAQLAQAAVGNSTIQ